MLETRIRLADVVADGVEVYPHDAAAVIHELCGFVCRQRTRPRAVPDVEHLAVDAAGRICLLRTLNLPEEQVVSHLGRVLRQLLATRGLAAEPVEGDRLLAVASRAITGGSESFADVKAFGDELGRIDREWRRRFLRDLFQRAHRHRKTARSGAADVPPPIVLPMKTGTPKPRVPASLGDLRTIREANGLSLATIAERMKVQTSLLAELEAGSFRHWPPGVYRRSWIRAYAREAGLDPDAVVALVGSGDGASGDTDSAPVVLGAGATAASSRPRTLLQRWLTGTIGLRRSPNTVIGAS
jgi:transcriptional regulator with XRE-family HTH domain